MALALVTGGSRGIGRAVCLALAERGYDVAFCYASDDAAAEQTARLIETRGAGALAFRCDVSDEAAVKQMFSSLPASACSSTTRASPCTARSPARLTPRGSGSWR